MPVSDAVRKLIAGTLGTVNLRNNLERILGLYVEEAPEDGTPYARQDGTWVAGGGGGQTPIQFRFQGADLAGPGSAWTVDFTGSGVVAGIGGNDLTVNISGGGSSERGIVATLRTVGSTTLTVGTDTTLVVPYDLTITTTDSWVISSDTTASVVVDVQRATVAAPNTFASIAASAKPTLTADDYATGAMTGWATSILAGERLRLVVDSASGTDEVQVMIPVTAT